MADASSSKAQTGQTIPKVEFIEDVAAYLEGKDSDRIIEKLRDDLATLRMVERDLLQKRIRLGAKLPEIQRALEIVKELIDKQAAGQEVVSDFLLAEGVYAKGCIKGVKTVNLWLGANVMLEYTLEEARELLATNFSNCKANLKTNEEDLAYMKDSITTLEVSVARCFNYDVERRRKAKDAGEVVA